ncbi:MAG: DsrE family protein [Bacteroidales bacterium]
MENEKLTILWTSGEKDVALKVVLRYAEGALEKGMWKAIDLIIWGPSVQIAADDETVRLKVQKLIEQGVKVKACIVCAEEYGVTETLEKMNVQLEMVGEEITHIIQDQTPLLSL